MSWLAWLSGRGLDPGRRFCCLDERAGLTGWLKAGSLFACSLGEAALLAGEWAE